MKPFSFTGGQFFLDMQLVEWLILLQRISDFVNLIIKRVFTQVLLIVNVIGYGFSLNLSD